MDLSMFVSSLPVKAETHKGSRSRLDGQLRMRIPMRGSLMSVNHLTYHVPNPFTIARHTLILEKN